MKTVYFYFVFFLVIASPLKVEANEKILSFNADIILNEDSSFIVTEKIKYDFAGNSRRGIFRDIPLYYQRKIQTSWGKVSTRYGVRLKVLTVTDESKNSLSYKLISMNEGLRIRIGKSSIFHRGQKEYWITYKVRRAINRFEDKDEFYWNAIGNYWKVPIDKASVRVSWPGSISPLTAVNYYGYVSSVTSVKGEGEKKSSTSYSVTKTNLMRGQGITIGLAFPKGALKEPSRIQKIIWIILDNIIYLIWFPFSLLTFLFFYFTHKKKGRDPYHPNIIQVSYEPPDGLSPAEVGALQDEVVDTKDVVATILDLAARGYLKIKETEGFKLFFLSQTDYKFIKINKDKTDLSDFEGSFLSHVFSQKEEVLLSDLKNKFYVHLPSLKSKLYKSLVVKKMFGEDPSTVRSKYIAGSFFVIIVFHVLLFFLAQTLLNPVLIFGIAASGVISILIAAYYSKHMPRKTKTGVKAYYKILGFKEFIQRVEESRIKTLFSEDPEIFGRMLPYALVLGCADQWAEKFEGLITEPLSWYESRSSNMSHFSSRAFVDSMGHGINTMANTFSSAPQSNGGAGGGGGFSSGSSGGGFGGGGGGSW